MRLIPQPSTGYPVAMTRICAISADGVIHANSSILLLIRRRGKGINHINDKENMCIYTSVKIRFLWVESIATLYVELPDQVWAALQSLRRQGECIGIGTMGTLKQVMGAYTPSGMMGQRERTSGSWVGGRTGRDRGWFVQRFKKTPLVRYVLEFRGFYRGIRRGGRRKRGGYPFWVLKHLEWSQ